MKRQFDDYTRLARGIFGVSSLWLGPKDILYVRGVGVGVPFVEEYLRFELDRIQSVSFVKTSTGMVLNLIYGTAALVSAGLGGAAVAQAVATQGGVQVFLTVLAVPLLLLATVAVALLIINVVLGPTCQFQLQTATKIQRIRPSGRTRTARRVLAQLAPAVLAAQGGGR